MTQRETLMKAAKKHARLALIYADDGAFATAAKLLRETADLFDAENGRRDLVRLFHEVKGYLNNTDR